MSATKPLAAALILALGLPPAAVAQDRPPAAGERTKTPAAARPDAKPAVQGKLVPPDEPALTPPPPAEPADPAKAQGRLTPPAPDDAAVTQGRLIPPEAPAADAPPAEPLGPPAHSLLREDDFAFAACRLELARLGTGYTVEAPVTGDERDCGIDRPVKVTEILPGVAIEGGALMRCDTARSLAWWMRDVVAPAAAYLPGAPRVTALSPGSTYDCRATRGASTTNLSEHALGNAFDVSAFVFDDGARLAVTAGKEGSTERGFLAAVRWSACMIFTTVLGPGSNAAHEDHLHLDIKARRGGYRLCE